METTKLCAFCSSLDIDLLQTEGGQQHHSSYDDLCASAEDGALSAGRLWTVARISRCIPAGITRNGILLLQFFFHLELRDPGNCHVP